MLFDLDGTLLDSAPDLGAAADKMRTDRGLPSLAFGALSPDGGRRGTRDAGCAFGIEPVAPEFDALREEFFRNYETRMLLHTRAFEGVDELIEALRAGLPWGVVTNKSKRFTEPLTAAIPLFASAGAIVSGDTTPYAKPHPEPLFEAARRLGVEPPIASTSATTNGTSGRARRGHGARWQRPTATWASRPSRALEADADIHRSHGALAIHSDGLKYDVLGLHWFRRGFGIAAGHVELNELVNQI